MNHEEAVLASQVRLMLGQAEAMTAGQGPDRLGNCLQKHGLKPIVQAWLNDEGLRMVEYSIRSDVCNVSPPAGLTLFCDRLLRCDLPVPATGERPEAVPL
jgi:hypothetical protein